MQVVDPTVPLDARVRLALRDAIRSGELAVGAVLPSEKALEAAHGVSRITVRRALEDLEREGLVALGRGRQARVVESLVSAVRTEVEDRLARSPNHKRLASTRCEVIQSGWRCHDEPTLL